MGTMRMSALTPYVRSVFCRYLFFSSRRRHTIFDCDWSSDVCSSDLQPLLDAVVDYLPSPLDVPPIVGIDDKGNEVVRKPNDKEPLALLAFKIMDDPFVGTITFCRIYSGTLTSGTGVINSTKERKERIGRMLLMHANNREDIKEAYAGDIVALAGLKEVRTGDTLCDPAKAV